MNPEFSIERLQGHHNRSEFDCGESSLNEYLQRFARQNDTKGFARTFVIVRQEDPAVILGYYTLSSGQVGVAELPEEERRRLPRYPIPIIRIGRLASARLVQGQGLGRILLVDAFRRSLNISEKLGVYMIQVDALNDAAVEFYRKYGFQALSTDTHKLYLPLKTIRKLFV